MPSYQLPVEETLKSAWAKVHGAKATIWAALGILFAIVFCLGIIQGITEAINHSLFQAMKLITNLISYFLQLGVVYIGICRAKDQPIAYQLMFRPFGLYRALSIIGLYIAEMVLFILPLLIGVAGGFVINLAFPLSGLIGGLLIAASGLSLIYLVVRLIPSLAIILDQDANPIEAIKRSFHLTKGNVLRLCLLSVIQIIILLICIIPLGIGLIWGLPFTFITYGTIYQTLLKNQTA